MAIMAECPICRKKQSVKNKRCTCGQNMDAAKRSQRVRYGISYRMPDGKQRRESVGAFEGLNAYSKTDAEIAMSKREVQKREKRILDMLPESTITFRELSDWYLDLPSKKKLASYKNVTSCLNKFNEVFGNTVVGDIKKEDLENYQTLRAGQGLKPSSIDKEIIHAGAVVSEAFLNEKVDGKVLRAFKALNNVSKRGANARKRTVSHDEYLKLLDSASVYFKPVLIVAFNTGMRQKELQKLQWKHIDREEMYIRLPGEITKTDYPRNIPINHHVKGVLDNLPRAITHDYVFTHRGKPFTHGLRFLNQIKKTCEDAGVPYGGKSEDGITMRDIRRTVKTSMLNAGVDPVYRDLILGHSLKGMDRHYLSPSEDTLKEAMAKFTNWLDRQLENANVDQSVDHEGVANQ